ncbi:MAG: hypothetical protein ACRDVC_02075 [Acidimicrobiales bacterium]
MSGSATGYAKTPGSFTTMRNLSRTAYLVPLDAAISVQPVCY